MKKTIYSKVLAAGVLVLCASCDDFLTTESPSKADASFVFSTTETARAALEGAYDAWRTTAQNDVFGDGLYYAADVCGSDIERHPENFANQPGRHYPECFYQNGKFAGEYGLTSYLGEDAQYARLYATVSKACIVIEAIKKSDGFKSAMDAGIACTLGQMYGEAVALKATAYRELLRNFGDVPYVTGTEADADKTGLDGRDYIYDKVIAELVEAAPLMYRVGEIPGISGKNYFSRTYVEGLIGRMSLDAAGYQTRRGDVERIDGEGKPLTYETKGKPNNGATYGRRTDYKKYVELAQKYFKAVIDNPGKAKFSANYHDFFDQLHMADETYAEESIYEYAMTQGEKLNNARPYSLGRPTTGASSNNYPCKNYGQGRINPAFYYGMFDPNDKRRDLAVAVTGTKGADGSEILLPFKPGSQGKGGGLACNKFDENRQEKTWIANQRKSGINGPYMRMAEMYLGYAEACATLDPTSKDAKDYLKKVRTRAFGSEAAAKTDEFIASKESLLEAVIDERGFEFAGEGDRRWTLIRTGFIAKKVREIKNLTHKMIEGLRSKHSFLFDNGNVISDYVWTKYGDLTKGNRLVREADPSNPFKFPGWRGVHNDWAGQGADASKLAAAPNLAIQGLFKELTADEITALEADGYTKEAWGIDLVNNQDEYDKYLFYDYDTDYDLAPIYLWPFTPNVMQNGGFTNGYGFRN